MTVIRGRVLLVEDVATVRRMLAHALVGNGFIVSEAASFDEALKRLDSVEIVVTDLELGGRSGVDLIGEIRQHHPQMSVIAMSGNPSLLKEASLAGATAVLAKPFELDQLRVVTTLAALAVAAEDER
jgi:two-component system response regulator FlrC